MPCGSARGSTSTGSPTTPTARWCWGVVITGDGARGLDGHSDADAVAHAIADAVLGAAGLGDLGRHFPTPTRSGPGPTAWPSWPRW